MRIFLITLFLFLAYAQYELKEPIIHESVQKLNLLEFQIEKKMRSLETPELKITSSTRKHRDSEGLFIPLHPIAIVSSFRRDQQEDAESDLCAIVQKIVALYNSIPQIRPYLREFPVGTKQVDIWINYGPAPEEYYQEPYFSLVHLRPQNEHIEFRKCSGVSVAHFSTKPAFAQKNIHEVEILKSYMEPMVSRKKENVDPIFIEEQIRKSLHSNRQRLHYPILERMRKRFRMNIAATREISEEFYTRGIASGFWAQNRKIELNQAKHLAESFIQEYLKELRGEEIIQKTSKKKAKDFQDFKNNLNWFGFRITFWDEYLNRVEAPFIAQIQCQGGRIIYFAADSGQRLYQVYEESISTKFFPKKSSQEFFL
ncbi:MAG: hypothetical protein QRY74_00300 [Chlamydia sp.]